MFFTPSSQAVVIKMNQPAALFITIIAAVLKTERQCPFFDDRLNCSFMDAVETSPNAALECAHIINNKTTEQRYFYTCLL